MQAFGWGAKGGGGSDDDAVPWTPASLRRFMDGRAGGGGVWKLEGGIIALGTGRVLAGIYGVDEYLVKTKVSKVAGGSKKIANASKSDNPTTVVLSPEKKDEGEGDDGEYSPTFAGELISRPTLFYTDSPTSRRRLRSFRYRPTVPARVVNASLTPVTSMRLSLDSSGGLTLTRREARTRLPGLALERNSVLRSAWSYVARPMKKSRNTPARPGAVECFDYHHSKDSNTMSWNRVSRCPSWYGGGQCLTYVTGKRVDGGWNKLDTAIKLWLGEVGRNKPLVLEDYKQNK